MLRNKNGCALDMRLFCFVLVLWFLPVAFVSLSTTELEEISAWRRLKIFSAGVWHNIVLSGIAYVLLVNLVPAVFAPLFQVIFGVNND